MPLRPRLTSISSGLSTADQETVRDNLGADFFALRENQRHNGAGDLPRLRMAIAESVRSDAVRPIRLAIWGDSVAEDCIGDSMQCRMIREWGLAGRWLSAQAQNGTWFQVASTGLTRDSSDFEISPDGYSMTLTSGGEIRIYVGTQFENDLLASEMVYDKAIICYARESGAGTFDVETRLTSYDEDESRTTQASGVDASNGSLAFGSVEVDLPGTPLDRLYISHASGGDIRFIGVLFYKSDSNGIIYMPLDQGGINVGQVDDNTDTAVLDGLMAVLKPHAMLVSMKDDLADVTDHLDNFVTKMENGWPYFDWGFVLPTAGEGDAFYAAEEASTDFIREYAKDNGHAVFDQRAYVRQWEDSQKPMEPARSLTTLTRSGTTATATLAGHGYEDQDVVAIAGASESNLNSTHVKVTVLSSSQFTYAVANTGATSATGATVQRLAGTFQDSAHLSSDGVAENSSWVMRSLGLLDHGLAREGRDVYSKTVEASLDIKHNGRSLATVGAQAAGGGWMDQRGLVCNNRGVMSTGDAITDVGTGDFTLSAIVRQHGNENWEVRIQNGSGYGNANSFALRRSNTDQIRITVRDTTNTSGGDANYSGGGIDEFDGSGELVHLVAVRESGAVRVYMNGVLQNWSGATGEEVSTEIDSTTLWAYPTATSNSQVEWHEVGFWPSALTHEQVLEYTRHRIAPSGAEVLWQYKNNGGNFVEDASGNGRHGWSFLNQHAVPVLDWANPENRNRCFYSEYEPGTLYLNTPHVLNASGDQEWTLPTPDRPGDYVEIVGVGSGGWSILQPANHQIFTGAGASVGTNATTAGTGGSLSSTARYDSVRLVCVKADHSTPDYEWVAIVPGGVTLTWV